MKLLLHICCAPCSLYPYKELKIFSSIVGFFYNPNIHPFVEYNQRKSALEEHSRKNDFKVLFHKYDVENFFRKVSGSEKHTERCKICWRMRLEETANVAKMNGFDSFTTTLLISPYQDQEHIKSIGRDIAKKVGIDFFYKDFRDGFRVAQEDAKKIGLYRQKYCGCIFSERERFEKRKKK